MSGKERVPLEPPAVQPGRKVGLLQPVQWIQLLNANAREEVDAAKLDIQEALSVTTGRLTLLRMSTARDVFEGVRRNMCIRKLKEL